MIWSNVASNALIKYYDNGIIRTLLWSSGLGDGQILTGGTTASGNLILQSTSHSIKGSIIIPEFNTVGFIKNDTSGNIIGGNSLSSSDIPAHASLTSVYGDADITHYNISLNDIKRVQLEMLATFAEAHAKKQILRTVIDNAITQEELDNINFE